MTYEDLVPLFESQKNGTMIPTNFVTDKGCVFLLKETIENLQKLYKEEMIISHKLSFFQIEENDERVDVCLLSFFLNQEFLYFIPYNIHSEVELLLLNLFLVSDHYEIIFHNPEAVYRVENIEKETLQAIELEEQENSNYDEMIFKLLTLTSKEELFAYIMLINYEIVPPILKLDVLEKKTSYNI